VGGWVRCGVGGEMVVGGVGKVVGVGVGRVLLDRAAQARASLAVMLPGEGGPGLVGAA